MNRLAFLLAITVSLVVNATIPETVVKEAETLRPTLVEAVSGDAALLKDANLSAKAKLDLQYRFEDAFLMHRIDPSRVDSATAVSEAVVQDHVYYVPMCTGGRCPFMASFRAGDGGAELVSVGHPNAAARLEAATKQLGGEKARIVDFPESQTSFLLVQRNGEEILLPQSAAEEARLRGLLGLTTPGPLQLRLADLKKLTERVRAQLAGEEAEREEAALEAKSAAQDSPTSAVVAMAEAKASPASTEPVTAEAPTAEVPPTRGATGFVVLGAVVIALFFVAVRRRSRR